MQTATNTPRVGQIWRDDLDGYLYRVVVVSDNGIWVRHPNAKSGGNMVNPAWFDHWHLTRDVQ